MRFSLSDLIDNILLFATLSVVGFIAIGYFSKSSATILIGGFLIGLGSIFFINFFKEKSNVPKKAKKEIAVLLNHFIYSGKPYCENYFFNAFSTRYSVTKCDGYLIVNKTAVFIHLLPAKLSHSYLADAYSKCSGLKRIIILCAQDTDVALISTASMLPNIKIDFFDFNRTVNVLKWLGSVPAPTVKIKIKTRSSIKLLILAALDKKRARHYLFAALLLLLSALILPFGVYYTVIGALLATLAVLCKLDIVKLVNHHAQNKQKDSR